MSAHSLGQRIGQQRSSYSSWEKGMIIFLLVAFFGLLSLPIVTLSAFEGSADRTFSLLINPYMRKTNLLVLLVIAFLLLWNVSHHFKHKVHQLVGFKENEGLVNFGGLFVLLIALFTLGDTIHLLQTSFSYRIQAPVALSILQGYILIGMLWTLFLARYHHKQKRKSHDVTIAHEIEERKRQAFEHVEKEYGSLFHEDDEDDLPSRGFEDLTDADYDDHDHDDEQTGDHQDRKRDYLREYGNNEDNTTAHDHDDNYDNDNSESDDHNDRDDDRDQDDGKDLLRAKLLG